MKKKERPFTIDTNNLHHAYLLQGTKDSIAPTLHEIIEQELSMKIAGHPDIEIIETEAFTVSDGATLRQRQSQSAFLSGKKIFVIYAETVITEAQHALLKTFEEPAPNTHFFLVVERIERLLPTLLSRMRIVLIDKPQQQIPKNVEEFVRGDIPERLALVGKIIAKKDKERAREFVEGLIRATHESKGHSPEFLAYLLRTRSYLMDRSPSLKMLLEGVALTYPREIET